MLRKKAIMNVFMNRDGLSPIEAEEQLQELEEDIMDDISSGDFDSVEETLLCYGLELDYIC